MSLTTLDDHSQWRIELRPAWQERRKRRSVNAKEAIAHQLDYVVKALELDAMVLADELGFPIAWAGDPDLAALLADAAMWTGPQERTLDAMTLEHIQTRFPHVQTHEIFFKSVRVPGQQDECKLIATGRSAVRGVGVEHASDGIKRIASISAQT